MRMCVLSSNRSTATLVRRSRVVFSKTAGSRPRPLLEHAGRDADACRGRRMRYAVGGRRAPVRPAEARGERPDAAQADGEADGGEAAIGRAQERGGAREAAGQE